MRGSTSSRTEPSSRARSGGVVFSSPNSSLGGYSRSRSSRTAAGRGERARNMLGGRLRPGRGEPLPPDPRLAFDSHDHRLRLRPDGLQPERDRRFGALPIRRRIEHHGHAPETARGTRSTRSLRRHRRPADRPRDPHLRDGSGRVRGVRHRRAPVRIHAGGDGHDTPGVQRPADTRRRGAGGRRDGHRYQRHILLERSSTTAAAPGISPQQAQTGIVSVALLEGAVNVTLGVDPFETGAASVGFRVHADARGAGMVTDGGRHRRRRQQLRVPPASGALPPGPLHDETICSDGDFLLSVSKSRRLAGGDVRLLGQPAERRRASPAAGLTSRPQRMNPFPCEVLTIDSPVFGADGDDPQEGRGGRRFEPNLRMLYSHSQLFGRPPDVPGVHRRHPDRRPDRHHRPRPTRVKGSATVVAGQESPAPCSRNGARASYCGRAGGRSRSGRRPGRLHPVRHPADCNDQAASSTRRHRDLQRAGRQFATAPSTRGTRSRGRACRASSRGSRGACAVGTTSCADGPLVCRQTVRPVQEIACNGVDDDCDGSLDEAYVFNGYLPPIKADGTTAFLRKRGAIPVKFALHDCAGASITGAVARIEVHFVQNGVDQRRRHRRGQRRGFQQRGSLPLTIRSPSNTSIISTRRRCSPNSIYLIQDRSRRRHDPTT